MSCFLLRLSRSTSAITNWLLALVVAVIAKGRADRLDRQLNGTRRGFESRIDDFEDNYDDDGYGDDDDGEEEDGGCDY